MDDAGDSTPAGVGVDATPPSKSSRRWRWIVVGLALVMVCSVYAGWRVYRAGEAAQRGKTALLEAETSLANEDLEATRSHLNAADAAFRATKDELGSLGPLNTIGSVIPIVRKQLEGADAFADSGLLLTRAADRLTDATALILHPANEKVSIAEGVDALRTIHDALDAGTRDLNSATAEIQRLDGYRLFGPLGAARKEFGRRLPEAQQLANDATNGVDALLAFAGADGPRRFLLFSENPDEVRPTGGFIGTYGVLATDGRKIHIERYESIESWVTTHSSFVPSAEAPTAFRIPTLPREQSLANTNAIADVPTNARLALDLWKGGGEQPADGVIYFTPELLVRLVKVLGPVTLPDYGETVTADNLLARLNFYAHEQPADERPVGGRKQFVADLGEAVVQQLLDAPASQWRALSETVGQSLHDREVTVYASDPAIEKVLATRGWDGTLPQVGGDFFNEADFEYAAKNGRGIRRTFDHHVVIHDDGSATVDTTITIANTLQGETIHDEFVDIDASSYITLYGPAGARLSSSADSPVTAEPALGSHPAAGWFRTAPPNGTATLHVVWDVPAFLAKDASGSSGYQLTWLRVPTTTGDVVHLSVDLPPGLQWTNGPPPSVIPLTSDIRRFWPLMRSDH